MKNFLSHALPLCLALLIFVGSLVVPAFAADVYTLSGDWSFVEDVSFDGIGEGLYIEGEFLAYGDIFKAIVVEDNYVALVWPNDEHYLYFQDSWKHERRIFSISDTLSVSAEEYAWLVDNLVMTGDIPLFTDELNSGVSIVAVFTGISTWIVEALGNVMPMFYTEASGLTFIGTLVVAGLAFSVIFLVVAVIRRFLHFGG